MKLAACALTLLCAWPVASAQTAAEPGSAPTTPSETAAPESRPTVAQTATEEDREPEAGLWSRERLTGNWGGVRPWIEEHGVTFDLRLLTIYQQNAHGGVRTHNAHRVSGSYDLELTLDFGLMKLWEGGTVYTRAEGSWDDGVSDRGYVGDWFGVNGDAGGDRAIDVVELWYEHALFDKKLRVRFGKRDISYDFDTNEYANWEITQFLNNALINNPTIPFPDPGLGVQVFLTPCDWFYMAAGVSDAEADWRETGLQTTFHGRADFVSMCEFGLTPEFETGWGKLSGNYRFGLWYDPQPKEEFFDDLDGRRRHIPLKRDDVGFYASFDQAVCRENPQAEDDEQGLGLFFRYGYAPGDVNEMENFWSVGGQYLGLIPTRDEDVLALGVAQGVLSKSLRYTGADPHRETVLETYYSARLLPWLTVSPDFQWILRPGGEDGHDAFVAGLRVEITF